MKNQYLMSLCTTILLSMACACNDGEDSAPYLGFEELKYIERFESRENLSQDSAFKSDHYIEDFIFGDSLVFSGSAEWDIWTLPDWRHLKTIFSQGHAYGEFLQIPKIFKAMFFRDNDDLCTVVYDTGNGNVYKVNITKTLVSDTLCIEKVMHDTRKWYDRYLYIDSTEYIVRENNLHNPCAKKITYFKNNEPVSNKYFDHLNEIAIHSDDFNVLAAFEGYNPHNRIIVQAYKYFNVINIIPLNDEEKAVTICYGDKGIPMNEVETTVDRKRFFHLMKTYDDCFAVLCLKDENKPTIQLYDYKGNTLKEYLLPEPATSYDFDWKHHHLYTYDEKDDIIRRYAFDN